MGQLHRILEILADGNFHSGQHVGETLGISRSAVWKILKNCADIGVELHIVRGRGYRIPGGIELLNKESITNNLSQQNAEKLSTLDVLESIDSTNKYLLTQNDIKSGHVCIAEQQLSGRGRHGREWVSPYARNVYLSMLWKFNMGPSRLGGLSLVAGIAVIKALQRFGTTNIGLKWPNDIMYHGRKLGGILVEISGDVSGPCQVILGIGINTEMPKDYELQINQPWTDVASIIGSTPSRNRIAGLVLDELLTALPQFQHVGLNGFTHDWQKFDAIFDQKIVVQTCNGVLQGIGAGIDSHGNLLLKEGDKLHTFYSGEVSVKEAEIG